MRVAGTRTSPHAADPRKGLTTAYALAHWEAVGLYLAGALIGLLFACNI